ncbi:MAG: hypothetical protein DRH93_00800 [Deltaproteobacteria bacterium]|nr:MAG: hypothetical protein DRH93_00800 [Deltaproteobacteria bacterium]
MDETISLLPFIESGGEGFLLDIPVLDSDRNLFQGYSYPFQIVDKGQHLSIIVKAGLKINDADRFKSLFLLVQRDDYPILPDDLTPFTNVSIDRIWLETIQSYSKDKNVFIVPKQLSREGKATAFRSLFYCKKQQKFFHPPCPECGTELDLCQDDTLLISKSLPPFSTSLKRYLFCPRCHAAKTNYEFYQFSRSADDPVFTKDRFDLIKDFSKLRSAVSSSFPCPDCPGHAECYITGEKAASHISFFSFYPFHMLFFDAQPIKAIDFLSLISGAPFERINAFPTTVSGSGRGGESPLSQDNIPFFFEGDERFFLEVLFLKLCFFEEFFRSLYQRVEKESYPLLNLSAQSIWIRLQSTGNSLPFFWSFKLSIIDLMVNSPRNYIHSVLSKNSSLHFMASLWFHTFLVNENQGQDKVYEEIGKLVETGLDDGLLSDYNQLIKAFPSVAMENIFWNPDDRPTPQKWHQFWLRIIVTGLSFFNGKKEQGLDHELNQLINKITTLKQEIKEELFSDQKKVKSSIEETPGADKGQVLPSSEKQAILLILEQLKTKWADQKELSPDFDDDALETIVLSSDEMEQDAGFDDIVEKTMVMMPAPQTEPAEDGGFNDMEETVIISSPEKTHQESDFFSEDDDLDKTIVITPKK